MTALGLPVAAVVVPFIAAAVGAITWLLADTPGLHTRSSASIGALLSDAEAHEHDGLPQPRSAQECA